MADPPLYKRGSIYWTWVQGRRATTGCRDRQAALLAARELERRAADPLYEAASKATWGSAVGDFLASLPGRVAGGTVDMYTQKLGHTVRLLGADTPLARIDAGTVDRYIEGRRADVDEQGRSAAPSDSTLGKELTAIRQVLKRCFRQGTYPRHPSTALPVGWKTGYQPRRRWLTPEQLTALCLELTPDRAAYLRFVVATGARRAELYAARPGDLDWEAGVVRLRGTKTDASDDLVPILPMLRDLLEVAEAEAPGRDLPLLFPEWGNARRDILAACKRAGVAAVTWNDLRRTAGQWLRRAGAEPHLIARFLRHTSSKMAETVYAHLDAAGLGQLLGGLGQAAVPPVRRVAGGGK